MIKIISRYRDKKKIGLFTTFGRRHIDAPARTRTRINSLGGSHSTLELQGHTSRKISIVTDKIWLI